MRDKYQEEVNKATTDIYALVSKYLSCDDYVKDVIRIEIERQVKCAIGATCNYINNELSAVCFNVKIENK